MLDICDIEVAAILPPTTGVRARRRPPLVVRPTAGGRYEIIVGWDAYEAALARGAASVTAVVRRSEPANVAERLVEHVCLRHLGPLEEARLFDEVIRTDGLTQRELARRFGLRQPHISKRLMLLRLSRTDQLRVESGALTVEEGQTLARQ